MSQIINLPAKLKWLPLHHRSVSLMPIFSRCFGSPHAHHPQPHPFMLLQTINNIKQIRPIGFPFAPNTHHGLFPQTAVFSAPTLPIRKLHFRD